MSHSRQPVNTDIDARLAEIRAEEAAIRRKLAEPGISATESSMLLTRLERLPIEVARKKIRIVQPGETSTDWRADLDGMPGCYSATPNNVAIALESSEEWRGALAWDEFGFRATIDRPIELELRRREPVTLDSGELPEHAAHHVRAWLDGRGMPDVGKELVWDTVAAVCRRRSYHPVREYLLDVWRSNPMSWEEARALLRGLWSNYFNVDLPACDIAPDSPAETCGCVACDRRRSTQIAGLCWAVSAVARMLPGEIADVYKRPDADRPDRHFGPGCLVKYVPVLVGDQDLAKSSGIAALSPRPEWCLDSRLKLDQAKDLGEMFRAKWLAEISEIDGYVRGHDGALLKAAISTRVETFRAAYARFPSDHPRQCVMVGTCNPGNFLRDPDNTVRFWILEVLRPIDTLPIARDRDRIWAAAVTCYVNGEEWWPARGVESRALRRVAEEAIELPSWADRLIAWLDNPAIPEGHTFVTGADRWPSFDYFHASDIIACSGLGHLKQPPKDHEIRKVLTYAGWTNASRKPSGKTVKVWVRPTRTP